MNREMKFRAFNHVSKQMYYETKLGDVFKWHNEGQVQSIMQFTGLKDKNKMDIYEGDILDFKYPLATADEDDDQDNLLLRVVIDFHDGAFWFNGGGYTDCNWHFYNSEDRELIGNIYENPELKQNTP
jgi:uncharacterized phage protein (TIGR01671 family)